MKHALMTPTLAENRILRPSACGWIQPTASAFGAAIRMDAKTVAPPQLICTLRPRTQRVSIVRLPHGLLIRERDQIITELFLEWQYYTI